jgi:hypothetical protein
MCRGRRNRASFHFCSTLFIQYRGRMSCQGSRGGNTSAGGFDCCAGHTEGNSCEIVFAVRDGRWMNCGVSEPASPRIIDKVVCAFHAMMWVRKAMTLCQQASTHHPFLCLIFHHTERTEKCQCLTIQIISQPRASPLCLFELRRRSYIGGLRRLSDSLT